jgi:hypothetical protein
MRTWAKSIASVLIMWSMCAVIFHRATFMEITRGEMAWSVGILGAIMGLMLLTGCDCQEKA